jgi:calcium-dependent protein kinase
MGCVPCNQSHKNKFIKLKKQSPLVKIQRSMLIQGHDGDPFIKYQQIKELGEGSYGKVYKVFDRINKTYRAMKKIKKDIITNKEETKIRKEIEILKMLDHPNILKIYEFYNTKSKFYIVTELLSGGELFHRISNNQCLEESVALYIMKQILLAVNYCHQKGIIHRDLKPENILIEDGDEKFFNVKIIDFGTSETFKGGSVLTKQIGTAYYIAPEVLLNKYNEKCDLWSCGVIMYILLSGTPPFKGKSEADIIRSVKSGKFTFNPKLWNNISSASKDLICKLLEVDVEKRYSAEQALMHPVFSDYESQTQTTQENRQTEKMITNMSKYMAYKNLQRASLYFIIHNCIPKEEFKEMKNLFIKFDSNCDGKLTKEELSLGFKKYRQIKLSEDELDSLMTNVDMDKSGFIEYEEFLTATFNPDILLTERNLKCAFNLFDRDGSGNISADELKEVFDVFSDYDSKLWNKLISEVDSDGDGEISFEEFKKMMFNVNYK